MELIKRQKIILITSGQPSLNPRLVKEADSLTDSGYQVLVIYQYWNEWGTELDKQLLASKKWSAVRVGGTPQQNKATYWLSRLRHKAGQKLVAAFGLKSPFAEMAIGRCTNLLFREALKHKAHLYIAHNLAALPAAVKAAKQHKVKCGFDAEDFHRYEVSDDPASADVLLKSYIENKYIPQLNQFWTSSSLIALAYRELFTGLNPTVILNAFPVDRKVSPPKLKTQKKLRLFWFSQTIGPNRGLEDLVRALKLLNNPNIELNLLGHRPPHTIAYLKNEGINLINVNYYQPMPGDDLGCFASQFDIGFAIEPGFCMNNKLAQSNKIFSYLQAGLAILLSNTPAQLEFLNSYPAVGTYYVIGNVQELANKIAYFYDDFDALLAAKQASYSIARTTLNWENESAKFLAIIKSMLA